MLEGCYRGIAGILKGVQEVLHGCYMGVLKGVIGGLYGVTGIQRSFIGKLQGCYRSFT